MMKVKTIIIHLAILVFIFILSTTKGESFDSEAISQVSKGIAEWKLMNKDKNKSQVEQIVYVSSSLSGMTERGSGKGTGVVIGLSAFDDDYEFKSQIKQWELDRGVKISSSYMSRLPTNPWPDIRTSIGGEFTMRGMGYIYGKIGQTFNEVANTYRFAGATSANRIADTYMRLGYGPNPLGDVYKLSPGGIYVPQHNIWINEGNRYRGLATRLSYPTDATLQNTGRGLRIYQGGTTIIGTTLQAAETFQKTVHYVGTSAQIMNPPIYLHEKTSDGWKGGGSYPIRGGQVYYQETLKTGGTGPITRTHIDWVNKNAGSYIRTVEIKTPATNGFERFMMYNYPVGSYFDPKTSTMTTTIRSQSYRVESTVKGIGTEIGRVGTGMGNISTLPSMPSITKYPPPNVLFSIKNPLDAYKPPPIPKMPAYIPPRMPSSSPGRRY